MKPNKKIILPLSVFILFWLVLIFAFSAQGEDGSNSASYGLSDIVVRIITPDFESLADGEQAYRLWQVNVVLRKLAHFFLYTILGMLLHFTTGFIKRKPRLQLGIALLLGLLLSALDEFHQYFVPGRTARLLDVGIDFLGILLGCFLFWLLMQLKQLLSRKRNQLSAES